MPFFSWTKISELKAWISKKNGFPKEKQKLFYKQNELSYGNMTLEHLLDDKDQNGKIFDDQEQTEIL